MTAASGFDDPAFLALARELSAHTGVALDSYKPKCLRRRIMVRMRAVGVHTYDEYRALLARSPEELSRLNDAITINVTRFYRNPEAWASVAEKVIAPLVAGDAPVRVWSAGCAGGEEAYTVAMLWAEACGQRSRRIPGLSVDATDIDRVSLARARSARYPPDAFVETPAPLVERWTAPDGDARVVVDELRRLVQVSKLDLTQSAYPTGIYEIVCCRNVVIYFDRALQERLFMGFHDALRPGGFLVLGKVETLVGPARERLRLVDVRERVYQRPA